MAHNTLRTLARGAVASACFVLGSAAHAAVYLGSWDPSFGGSYPNLGFRGENKVFVDDACLAEPGYYLVNTCGSMGLLNATVGLFDFGISSTAPTLETLTFADNQIPDSAPIRGVLVALDAGTGRNEVTGVDTFVLGPRFASAAGLASIYQGPVWLEFVTGMLEPNPTPVPIIPDPAFIYIQPCDEISCDEVIRSENGGAITYERVPEPGTLALILSALGISILARRRRATG